MKIDFLKGNKQYNDIDFYRRGGMGEIYLAIDTFTNEKKAVKIIPINNIEEYKLIKTEFDISLSLKHSNIIDTEFSDEFEYKGTKYLYSIMKFYTKGSLRDFINISKDLLSLELSIKYMLDISKALEYAHTKIVHRDLKPENLLLNDNNEIVICDFGLAKMVDSMTRTKTFKGSGTLPYMSPECWLLESNTKSMDIYSLGIIFYELLTLKLPFIGRSENEIRDKHLYENLPKISDTRKDVPPRLIEMINKMTSKRPQNRYNSMTEVITVLNDITKKDAVIEDSGILKIINKANQKVNILTQAELEEKKKREDIETSMKFTEYSINNLFDVFEERVNKINKNLERTKIKVSRSINYLSISFLSKGFNISFYPTEDLKNVIKRRYEAIYQHQQRSVGIIYQKAEKSHLEKDYVILIGQIALNFRAQTSENWGYNLVLRKNDENDLYGEWWLVWFDDALFNGKSQLEYHYFINIPEFYKEYEIGRGRVMSVRNMNISTIVVEKIDELIEKILE